MTMPRRDISEDEALRIAKDACATAEVPWREPYSIRRGLRAWQVRTPSNRRGGNTTILVSRSTGEVTIRRYSR